MARGAGSTALTENRSNDALRIARDCWVAVLTPAGRGAVATIVVRGTAADAVVDREFRPARGPALGSRPGRVPVFGYWSIPGGGREEVVVCRFEPTRMEVHCHGGPQAAAAILQSLASLGARPVAWWEIASAERPTAIEFEAAVALARCRTPRTARVLLDQLDGALRRAIYELRELTAEGTADVALRQIEQLLATASFGWHLSQPWRVALAGRPNVGKSCLMNALAGFNRSIVDDIPGTTRDLLSVDLVVEGWPIQLVDTAGLRRSENLIESAGIERARTAHAAADLVVIVADASGPWTSADQSLVDQHPSALVVHNKSDLPATAPECVRPAGWSVSALTGAGVGKLLSGLADRLVPDVPDAGAPVVFSPHQVERLESARLAIRDGDHRCAGDQLASLLE